MTRIIDVLLPVTPECWESCGACASGDLRIDDIRVLPGDRVERDDTLLVVETGKVALDIPAPCAGRVHSLCVAAGDTIFTGQRLLRLEAA
ncbi:biotin/lipoyl-containing protein [Rhodocyclus tenuis]|uniref:Biotin carboxyl carrier protein n=1 Tax=Rhodocyclus tenuis TaxID=1066 RepID=A0A840GIB9_RHOTE|nr:lipoyl domain-containing protein [Rhodocyclus tenuis]MBB4247929.1 biotin carboxyl carrier protein [Rhodocyclus tenuis]MBK1679240.1 hypothetical protein [Rhodocyclus tenuis]